MPMKWNEMKSISKWDKRILGLVFLLLVLCYNEQADIRIILRASDILADCILHGKILDFYSVTLTYDVSTYFIGMAANYNILVYLFVLLVTLPMRLLRLGFGLFGASALISEDLMVQYLHFAVAGFAILLLAQVKKLLTELTGSKEEASLAAFLLGASPLFLIAVIGYTQIDVVYMLLTVIAIRYYIRGRMDAFSWIMALAIAFKTFPVIFFLPLLLAAEKRILPLIRHLAEGASLTLIFWLLYGNNAGYQKVQAQFPEFMERFFQATMPNGREGSVAILLCALAALCFFNYYRDFKGNYAEMVILSTLLPAAGITLFFNWNVNYLIMMAAALGLALPYVADRNRFIAIGTVGYVGFLIYWMLDVWHWYGICDAYLIPEILGFRRPALLPDFAGLFGDKATYISQAGLAVFIAAIAAQIAMILMDCVKSGWNTGVTGTVAGQPANPAQPVLKRGYAYLPAAVTLVFLIIHAVFYFEV